LLKLYMYIVQYFINLILIIHLSKEQITIVFKLTVGEQKI